MNEHEILAAAKHAASIASERYYDRYSPDDERSFGPDEILRGEIADDVIDELDIPVYDWSEDEQDEFWTEFWDRF